MRVPATICIVVMVGACTPPVPASVTRQPYEGRRGQEIVQELARGPSAFAHGYGFDPRAARCPHPDDLLVEMDIEVEDFAWGMARATQRSSAFALLIRPLEATGAIQRIEALLDQAPSNGLSDAFGWNERAAFWGATAVALRGESPWIGGFTPLASFEEALLSAYVSWLTRGADPRLWFCYEQALLQGRGGF